MPPFVLVEPWHRDLMYLAAGSTRDRQLVGESAAPKVRRLRPSLASFSVDLRRPLVLRSALLRAFSGGAATREGGASSMILSFLSCCQWAFTLA